MFWECPDNATLGLGCPEVLNTESWAQDMRQEVDMYPCLWLRGLLPANLVSFPAPPDECMVYSSLGPIGSWPGGVYFTDGSGGSPERPELLRCGCGFVRMDGLVPLGGWFLCPSWHSVRPTL